MRARVTKGMSISMVSIVLACAIVLPAFAVAPNAGGRAAAQQGNASVTGVINPTMITVTVPTQAAFKLGPSVEPGTDASAQIISAENYTITNWTVGLPVYTAITSLRLDPAGLDGPTVDFTDTEASVENKQDPQGNWKNTMMFSTKVTNMKPADFSTPADWMMVSASDPDGNYVAGPRFDHPFFVDQLDPLPTKTTGELAAASLSLADPLNPEVIAGGSLTMTFFAKAAAGESWVPGKKFLVIPTIMVKVTDWKTDPLTQPVDNPPVNP